MKILLLGNVPSKKNNKRFFYNKGKPVLLPSEKHNVWHEEMCYSLKKYIPNNPIERCKIEMSFYTKDKRKRDLSNMGESILDLLVDNRIIKDDNCFVCEEICYYFIKVDRKNPRVIIEITNKKAPK